MEAAQREGLTQASSRIFEDESGQPRAAIAWSGGARMERSSGDEYSRKTRAQWCWLWRPLTVRTLKTKLGRLTAATGHLFEDTMVTCHPPDMLEMLRKHHPTHRVHSDSSGRNKVWNFTSSVFVTLGDADTPYHPQFFRVPARDSWKSWLLSFGTQTLAYCVGHENLRGTVHTGHSRASHGGNWPPPRGRDGHLPSTWCC